MEPLEVFVGEEERDRRVNKGRMLKVESRDEWKEEDEIGESGGG